MPQGSEKDRFHPLEGVGRASFKQKQELEPSRPAEAEGRGWRRRLLGGASRSEHPGARGLHAGEPRRRQPQSEGTPGGQGGCGGVTGFFWLQESSFGLRMKREPGEEGSQGASSSAPAVAPRQGPPRRPNVPTPERQLKWGRFGSQRPQGGSVPWACRKQVVWLRLSGGRGPALEGFPARGGEVCPPASSLCDVPSLCRPRRLPDRPVFRALAGGVENTGSDQRRRSSESADEDAAPMRGTSCH